MSEVPRAIQPGMYRHSKTGNFYNVLGVARHSETGESLVVYEPLYESEYPFFVRPLGMFTEAVAINGIHVARFVKVYEGQEE